jgi:hypothetical protein
MKGICHNTFIKKRVYSDNEVDMKEFWTKNIFVTINNAIFNIGESWNDLQVQIFKDAETNYGPY